MPLGFGSLYQIVMFCFFLFFQKAENNRFKKMLAGQNFVIIYIFLLKYDRSGQ